ncbi:MAG: N-acetylneuraminate synthase family protein [Candidatus Lokiarchaeota archaeon]|nr:N-acetylneuraminate synthase family protein [Candidatus Lokiarchaeota archaeon]
MKNISLGNRKIGKNQPVFVIAEAGANHDRNLNQAKKLIEIAADAEADAVKFQTYSAETLYSKKTTTPDYLEGKMEQESVWQMIKNIELPREWQGELADYSRSHDLIFLSTPFDYQAIEELEALNVLAYKIASFEIVDLPFLKKLARTKKPIILSTGMASMGDIEDAINAIHEEKNNEIALLHCAINYPPPFKDLNLNAIKTLKKAFQLPVGYSDHTMSTTIPAVCVALGVSIIEKHYTIDRSLKGPDHKFALQPLELKEMVKNIRETEMSLGSSIKFMPNSEKNLYTLARRSIIAARHIPKGKSIQKEDIVIKRPGYGISPKFLDIVIGRPARTDIEEDDVITWDLI